MESKILPLNSIPDHPKFLRLPSLSRSLVHSILPKACIAMHTKPLIFSVSPCNSVRLGAPNFTKRMKKIQKITAASIPKPYNIRPNSPSYTYKKMFCTKPSTPMPKFKYTKLRKNSESEQSYTKSYYCEINVLNLKSTHFSPSPSPKFAKTLYNFKANFGSGKQDISDASEQCQMEYTHAKERLMMKNISEVRSSQESSNESIEYFHLKNLSA